MRTLSTSCLAISTLVACGGSGESIVSPNLTPTSVEVVSTSSLGSTSSDELDASFTAPVYAAGTIIESREEVQRFTTKKAGQLTRVKLDVCRNDFRYSGGIKFSLKRSWTFSQHQNVATVELPDAAIPPCLSWGSGGPGIEIDLLAQNVRVQANEQMLFAISASAPHPDPTDSGLLIGVGEASVDPTHPGFGFREFRPIDSGGIFYAYYQGSFVMRYETFISSAWAFSGFQSPVDAPPTINRTKAGSGVPVKFSFGTSAPATGSLDILNGAPRVGEMACVGTTEVDELEVTAAAGSSGLQFDPTTNIYTYVWKTDKSYAGKCYQFALALKDGSVHRANFNFTK